MAGRAWQAATVGAALLGAAAACRQLVGIGDEPPTDQVDAGTLRPEAGTDAGADADAEAGPPSITYAGAQCEACLQDHCSAQATACAGDPACSMLEGCLGACVGGDPACRARCVNQNLIAPNAHDPELAACLAANCASSCNLPCGGFGQYFGVDAAAGCQACITSHVCKDSLACATQAGCQGLVACVGETYYVDREQACWQVFDAGLALSAALRTEILTSCLDECAIGNQWYCLGHAPPLPKSSSTSFTLTLFDAFTSSTPIPGAVVKVCSPSEPPCTVVGSGATTGADGGAMVVVPGNALGATGYLSISDGGVVPELIFWGFPLSEPGLVDSFGALLQTETSLLPVLLKTSVDPTRALVFVEANDCDNQPAPGVTFSITPRDPATQVFYLGGQGFVPTDAGTINEGLALFINVPVDAGGVVQVTATPRALGGRASSAVQGFVQAGTVTALLAPANQ